MTSAQACRYLLICCAACLSLQVLGEAAQEAAAEKRIAAAGAKGVDHDEMFFLQTPTRGVSKVNARVSKNAPRVTRAARKTRPVGPVPSTWDAPEPQVQAQITPGGRVAALDEVTDGSMLGNQDF
mmetsp:Transcript_136304/g.237004  ORF Transcript_136304/g.237004 Transcript_136304/m.237004 type:complete len:125 (-) Transcript_136304:121-495(-)